MPLAKDLSSLPRPARTEGAGLMPDAEPRFIQVLVEAWAEVNDDDKPTAMGTRLRHSDAGKCARALSFTAAGFERSDPMDLSGVWNVSLGQLLHDHWQTALQAKYPNAEVEVKVGWDDLDASGHIDAVITVFDDPDFKSKRPESGWPHRVIAYELKSIGGFGYKAAVGKARRGTPAEGPKTEHIAQSALNALAVDADEMVIGYLAKECISVNAAGGLPELARFCCEWTFTRDEFGPIAMAEKARMNGILELVGKGQLARRTMPDLPPGAEVVDPKSGRWEQRDGAQILDTGSAWNCGYCSFQSLCAKTPKGRPLIAAVREQLMEGAA